MILRNNILSLAATAAVFGIASVPAFAAGFNGTLFIDQVVGTSPLDHGTVSGTTITLNAIDVNSVSGDFSNTISGDLITFNSNTLTNGDFPGFSVAGYTFKVDPTLSPPSTVSLTFADHVSITFNGFVQGTVTNGAFTGPEEGFLNLDWSYVHNSTTEVNVSGTFTVQPGNFSTPEPGNMAILVGMSLSGVGFLVRRRRK